MSLNRLGVLGLVLLSGLGSARAQDPPGSLVAIRPLGAGQDAFSAELGFPGPALAWLHGVGPRLDVGALAAGELTFEGRLATSQPGLKLQLQARLLLLQAERWTLGATFEPGLFTYYSGPAGVLVPAFLILGWRAADRLDLALRVGAPAQLSLLSVAWFVRPAASAQMEFRVSRDWEVTAKLGAGPLFNTATGGQVWTLEALAGIVYRPR